MQRRILGILACCLMAGAARPAVAQIEQQPAQRELEEAEREAAKQKRQPRLTKPPKMVYSVPPVYPEAAKKEKR
mgnify:CR=1 FL=1